MHQIDQLYIQMKIKEKLLYRKTSFIEHKQKKQDKYYTIFFMYEDTTWSFDATLRMSNAKLYVKFVHIFLLHL